MRSFFCYVTVTETTFNVSIKYSIPWDILIFVIKDIHYPYPSTPNTLHYAADYQICILSLLVYFFLLLLLLIILSSLLLFQQIYQHSPNSMTNRHLQSKKSIFAGIQSYHKVKLLDISLFMYHKIKIKVMSFILMRIWFENKSHKQELCPDPLCAQRR